jgi:hypothetical protein
MSPSLLTYPIIIIQHQNQEIRADSVHGVYSYFTSYIFTHECFSAVLSQVYLFVTITIIIKLLHPTHIHSNPNPIPNPY